MADDENGFHGLVLPDGVEKRVLYHSSYRAIATYGASLADLDRELQGILHSRGCVVKEDQRLNYCGKSARAAPHPIFYHSSPFHSLRCLSLPYVSRRRDKGECIDTHAHGHLRQLGLRTAENVGGILEHRSRRHCRELFLDFYYVGVPRRRRRRPTTVSLLLEI